MSSERFVVLVPVKPPAVGKSRLVDEPEDRRRSLAAAFALDTVEAVLVTPGVGAVLAVTDDFRFADQLAAAGCAVVPDGVAGDLNASLVQAAAEAHRRWPHLSPVAVCADLPALRSADLAAALADVVTTEATFVGDADGFGTTLYAAPHHLFAPRFGHGSRAAHSASGTHELAGDFASLRRDVDDAAGLAEALLLGVGRHTAAIIAAG